MSIGWQILVNGLIAGSLYALIAMGFNLIYGVQRSFHLGHGVTALVAGYILLFLFSVTGLSLWFAIVIALVGAALVGLLMERIVFWPIRRRNGPPLIMVVASLGLVFLGQAIITVLFSSEYQAYPQALWDGIFEIGSVIVTKTQVLALLAAILVFLVIKLFLSRTSYGKAIRAVSDDAQVAALVGIQTERVIMVVFLIASLCAGLAGILTGFDTGLQPTIALSLLLKGAVAGVIGGLGTLEGAFLGAFLLGLVENLGIWWVPSEWKDAIAFGLLIVFLLFRRTGLMRRAT